MIREFCLEMSQLYTLILEEGKVHPNPVSVHLLAAFTSLHLYPAIQSQSSGLNPPIPLIAVLCFIHLRWCLCSFSAHKDWPLYLVLPPSFIYPNLLIFCQ